ncbi:glucose-6-phosphate dehydrogenase [Bacillus sp. Marseille-P3661]|uniref:glucose-6-phosphate dehydrogenase n=1 Tax=Bacillus sp. Marseille-P3661 TaxID=1936234 RepID=UPI000C8580C8|nr:glucose-6-phosphate dehydrogenase [Bacillus sp. Marseille-P3661]
MQQETRTTIILFGATGDLANRKLYPSIYNLFKKGKLKNNFAVVGTARRDYTHEEYRAKVKESIETSVKSAVSGELEKFLSHFYYHAVDINDRAKYKELKTVVDEVETTYNTGGNRLFYLAIAPDLFGTVSSSIKAEGLKETAGWKRLVIEKPFGHNLSSAEELNNQIRHSFHEHEIYRIDHYLGKEMVQNIEVIRFANRIFEPLWNNQYISNIQITSSETVGVEDRAGYYEKSGALKDMVQNHILQMVALIAMEPPIRLTPDEIRSEKIRALRSIRPISEDEVNHYFVRAQYCEGEVGAQPVIGYKQEENVSLNSTTETFVAGKIMIDNFRWAGVPFYIRTGKRMRKKATRIIVEFKDLPVNLYANSTTNDLPNILTIHIQPDEGMTLQLNAKQPGEEDDKVAPIALDYCQNCISGINTPEAYERLLYDCIQGDATNFTHWDEVALSWAFVDPISKVWNKDDHNLYSYRAGSIGPEESDSLLNRDGNKWWPLIHELNYNN